MLVLEAKLRGKQIQYDALDEAIRTATFVRNKAVRFWQDNVGTGKNDLQKLCSVLAASFEWAGKLNSMARQASADRAWFAISRFYANCKAKKVGKKGFPKFKKRGQTVEYKTSGWRLSEDKKYITFTDGFKAGKLKLIGTRDLNFYQVNQIKRVRVVRRADGYYCQFCVDVERSEVHQPTGNQTGIDVGLEFFYTDSSGQTIENPRLLRKSEKSLKRTQKRVSKCKKGSSNRRSFRKRLAKKHLKVQRVSGGSFPPKSLVSRQRKDFVVQTARALVQSSDLIVYEDLQVKNMVRNHHLAKSISDASWSMFTRWLDYFAKVYGIWAVAVPPHYTSQDCSGCGARVKKALSTRTHKCACGVSLHRDHNAAKLILAKGLNTVGQTEINASGQTNLWTGGATPQFKLTG